MTNDPDKCECCCTPASITCSVNGVPTGAIVTINGVEYSATWEEVEPFYLAMAGRPIPPDLRLN